MYGKEGKIEKSISWNAQKFRHFRDNSHAIFLLDFQDKYLFSSIRGHSARSVLRNYYFLCKLSIVFSLENQENKGTLETPIYFTQNSAQN
jgi:hypothetical protein